MENYGNIDSKTKAGKQKKRAVPESKESDDVSSSMKRPKRAAACKNFKEKSFRIPKKSATVEAKKHQIVEDEIVALHLTSKQSDDELSPTRRLTDFLLHDSDGVSQPVEMLEIKDIFISGIILPSDHVFSHKEIKEKGVRCPFFGRVERWSITGYEDGSPVIWISTELAVYECVKPATSYKKIYDYFFEKASASLAVYKKLSKASGGNPDTSLDELLADVVRSMSGSKYFSCAAAIKDFVLYQGQFIYNQLVGLDDSAKKDEASFAEIPALVSLRDDNSKLEKAAQMEGEPSSGTVRIDEGPEDAGSQTQDEDRRHAKLIHDEEYRKSMQRPRKKSSSAFASNKFYIKIDEDEIANDYPLPSYYKNNKEETDELLLSDAGYEIDSRDLPRRKLNNWALYNSDSRLISLELLPMKPCADIDVTIFGSGVVTDDDGSGYVVDDSGSSTQNSQSHDPDGMAIFLSQIKEWMIEYGAGMISVTIRTDMAWYRLGKPSKHYAPWYEAVLKTAKVGISIVTLLKEQTRVAKLSFTDVIKRLAAFQKMDKAYISSDPMVVERYVVVHGQIILQLFAEYPNEEIRRCPFVAGLSGRMEDKHHTKWIIKNKKKIIQRELNLNPRTGMAPASKREVMQATTTSLIKRIWGEFYSMYSLEDQLQENGAETGKDEVEDGEEEVEDEGEDEEDDTCDLGNAEDIKVSEVQKCYTFKKVFGRSEKLDIRWEGEILGNTSAGEPLCQQALVGGEMVAVGGAVILEIDDPEEIPAIYLVEYMFESSDHCKMLHGRLLQRGSKTVLGNAANERELFLSNECMTIQLKDLKGIVCLEIRSRPWGHQHRKENNTADKLDWERAKERKAKDLPTEFYCKSLYSPERGGFFSLPSSDIGRGSGFCSSCRIKEDERERSMIKLNLSKTGFISNGIGYSAEDYVYVNPVYITKDQLKKGRGTSFKAGKNIGLRAFVVCQLLEIIVPNESNLGSFEVKVRRFYRPEDISEEKAYASDIRELYYSEKTYVIPPKALEGICEVRKKSDMPLSCEYPILDHIFFCELFYDSSNGSLKLLPEHMKLKFSTLMDDTLLKKKKGKGIESEADSVVKPDVLPKEMRLATLDIFAGCGGLSQGLEKAGVSNTKWAIEYEEPAAQAFKQNHPDSTVFVNNCNVILRAIMERSGDGDDCISTPEAVKLAAKLDDDQKNTLPLPGQVDFINGGPPCQGFSGMNRFEKGTWSRVQRQMILAFLSFADYFRPKYFLLENVRTFVSHDKRQIFQLTVASLLEMGYQVRFGILEAGTYGVSQSRKRAFIWAAAPDEVLPEWPEPMHVFASPSFKIPLSEHSHYVAVRSTASGAPFRSITVKDTIGDLPSIENGESKTIKEYGVDPVSWFQKEIRGNTIILTDHVCKEMNELNRIRCKNIPKRPGADWRDLPNESVKLSTGQVEKLIPFCLPNTAERNNNWKGLYGRLDWQGNFPTSITDPQPMGKVGMCFHPEQDRICSVRECARSQGFPDSYIFSGNIRHKHKQIGNAVPPPLAFALGRKLKEALLLKESLQHQH